MFEFYEFNLINHHFSKSIRSEIYTTILHHRIINVLNCRCDIAGYTEHQLQILCRREECRPPLLTQTDVSIEEGDDKSGRLYWNGGRLYSDGRIIHNNKVILEDIIKMETSPYPIGRIIYDNGISENYDKVISENYDKGISENYACLSKIGKLYNCCGSCVKVVEELENIVEFLDFVCLDKYGKIHFLRDDESKYERYRIIHNSVIHIEPSTDCHVNCLSRDGAIYKLDIDNDLKVTQIPVSDNFSDSNIIDFIYISHGDGYLPCDMIAYLNWFGEVYLIKFNKILIKGPKNIKTIALFTDCCGTQYLYFLTLSKEILMIEIDDDINNDVNNNLTDIHILTDHFHYYYTYAKIAFARKYLNF